MATNYSFCISLFRGRRKKTIFLIFLLILVINAMFIVSLELFRIVTNMKRPWTNYLSFLDSKSLPSMTVGRNSMRVVVGHYVGGSTGANLTYEDINSNRYSPVPIAGHDGRPVQMSPREMIRARDLYSLHSYNILIGDKIPINRSLPDVRSESCKMVKYDIKDLPTASAVIVFHNEAWSTLMRTVMSVLSRSPDPLLKEVILVDDASERAYLGKELDDAIAPLPKVRLLRSTQRTGLVGARLMGARDATGDILIFLDAHCEVTVGWLEPLISRAGSEDVYICPHIDLINEETFAYTKSVDSHWGAFSWRLHFRWLEPSQMVRERIYLYPDKPYPTPVMAGGLFAVRRSLFWRLGGYDEGMRVWGGENLELSWRAWQCGASVEITACSRVGHIFRRHSPYTFPGGVGTVLQSNLARAALVWMDDLAEFFFRFNTDAAIVRDQQNVADRIALRKKLKCKSFDWYLSTVWPQHFFPTEYRYLGRLKNMHGACLGMNTQTPGAAGPAVGVQCGSPLELEKLVMFNENYQIMADNGLCLTHVTSAEKSVADWTTCDYKNNQRWTPDRQHRIHAAVGETCLTLRAINNEEGIGDRVKSFRCLPNETSQIWMLEIVPWKQM